MSEDRTEFGRELAAEIMGRLKGRDMSDGVFCMACIIAAMEHTARTNGVEPDRRALFEHLSRLIDSGAISAHSVS